MLLEEGESIEFYDTIILCDLIFNHSQHRQLLKTCIDCLNKSNPDSAVYVYFTHHRPKLMHKDMEFLELAQTAYNFLVERIEETKMWAMFEKDEGEESIRATVHGFKMVLKE